MTLARFLRRAIVATILVLLTLVLVLGIEIELALHRTYDPTQPPLAIGGEFGPADGQPLTFVVLGDSTAAGVGAVDASHAYPTLLAERLASHGRRVRLLDLGISGARVRDVLTYQVPKAVAASPDVVFVGIGANDATHLSSLGSVRADITAIVTQLQRTGAVVVVAGAPDMGTPAFLLPLRWVIGWRGRQVTSAIGEAARAAGAAVVPLADDTGRFFADDPSRYYSADRFHPGPAGYQRWADAIDPSLERSLAAG